MSNARIIMDYLGYRTKAAGKFRIHSPFVYQFLTEVIQDSQFYEDYHRIEELVSRMKREEQLMETTDFGANSRGVVYKTSYERVKNIAKTSSVNRQAGRLLYRIARYARPACILELGTSLGISTMYLAKGAPDGVIHSMEGCAAKSTRAERNFDKLGVHNIISHIGQFDVLLEKVLDQINSIDLLFLDGNHRQEPTINYFEKCSEKAGNDSIFIIDDIRWSAGMKQAWEHIKNHPRARVTLDLFSLGVIFFRRESSKQDFVLKF
jgi:predicted O-methyltransferase YrrM